MIAALMAANLPGVKVKVTDDLLVQMAAAYALWGNAF